MKHDRFSVYFVSHKFIFASEYVVFCIVARVQGAIQGSLLPQILL